MTTTRRGLGVLALGAAIAVDARAGTPAPAQGPQPQAPAVDDPMARAIAFRDKHAAVVRAAAARLPADVEPAFDFTARDTP